MYTQLVQDSKFYGQVQYSALVIILQFGLSVKTEMTLRTWYKNYEALREPEILDFIIYNSHKYYNLFNELQKKLSLMSS